MDKNCVFCKIVNHIISAEIVYEDDIIIAVMDNAPINPGHILVFPKEHYASSASIPENISGRMFYVASRLAVACKRSMDTDGYNLHVADGFCAGQDISHSHIHMIPRTIDDGFYWNWRKLELSDNELSELSEKIKNKLKVNS